MDIHNTSIFIVSRTNPVLADIIGCARNAEEAADRGDASARLFWSRELKKACRKQYK